MAHLENLITVFRSDLFVVLFSLAFHASCAAGVFRGLQFRCRIRPVTLNTIKVCNEVEALAYVLGAVDVIVFALQIPKSEHEDDMGMLVVVYLWMISHCMLAVAWALFAWLVILAPGNDFETIVAKAAVEMDEEDDGGDDEEKAQGSRGCNYGSIVDTTVERNAAQAPSICARCQDTEYTVQPLDALGGDIHDDIEAAEREEEEEKLANRLAVKIICPLLVACFPLVLPHLLDLLVAILGKNNFTGLG